MMYLSRSLFACLAMMVGVTGCVDTRSESGKNVILFLGDGMGVSTVTAARIFEGQSRGESGEENFLSFEEFPHVALVKTYNVDGQVSDSAGTMTAIMTGVKARVGAISVGPEAKRNDCGTALDYTLPTLLEELEDTGYRTGIISTARITHATPAATYAHSPERNWEADRAVPATDRDRCRDIARQLVEFEHGDGIDVVLGGGRSVFFPDSESDPEQPDSTGVRGDQRDLISEWLQGRSDRHYVWNRSELNSLPESGQVIGLFEPSHMQFEADRLADRGGEPSLAEMVNFALKRLDGTQGYFLMVEGGRIDHAHHAGNAYRALVDTVAFSDAVQAAVDATDSNDTLIIVTADHSHTLTMSGYPARGNPILGFAADAKGKPQLDLAGNAYTTLGYANGPGALGGGPTKDTDPTAIDYRQAAAIPMMIETHAGEDVAAYARGPGASGIHGVMDQNELYGVMRAVTLDL